jgi:hypothetical protein
MKNPNGHLNLIIKGNRVEALAAAKANGVTLFHTRPGKGRAEGETYAMCGDEYQEAVVSWFSKPPAQAPFPVGALLHWSEQSRV